MQIEPHRGFAEDRATHPDQRPFRQSNRLRDFTGSTEVGGDFLRYAGESKLKVIGPEMGGKSPFIVLDDADINDDLIEHAAMSVFWNGGQQVRFRRGGLAGAADVSLHIPEQS